jgi:fluoroacetyl-CoA thioesterase
MRPIPPDYEGRVEVVVTDEMTVDFAELGRVHPFYATYWLARHMEEAGRKIILPFLEDGEAGIGTAVSVRHRAPALPGMRVLVTAAHERTDGNRVHARCSATRDDGVLVADGETEQAIVPAASLERRLADVRAATGEPRRPPPPGPTSPP